MITSVSQHFILRTLVAGVVAVLLTYPLQSIATPLTTNITITGEINGKPLAASGISNSDTATGLSDTTITFTSVPSDFSVIAYGKSWKTKHHKAYAVSIGGTKNFRELSPSGYRFTTSIIYDSGFGTLASSGSVTSTGPDTDSYTLDIRGSYSGPLDAVGVEIFPALFRNVVGSPGDISMVDREIINFATGSTLEFTESGTFSLFSGALLPVEPDYLVIDVRSFTFDPGNDTLRLRTLAVEGIPEPGTLILFGTGLVALLGYAWRGRRQTA